MEESDHISSKLSKDSLIITVLDSNGVVEADPVQQQFPIGFNLDRRNGIHTVYTYDQRDEMTN